MLFYQKKISVVKANRHIIELKSVLDNILAAK